MGQRATFAQDPLRRQIAANLTRAVLLIPPAIARMWCSKSLVVWSSPLPRGQVLSIVRHRRHSCWGA